MSADEYAYAMLRQLARRQARCRQWRGAGRDRPEREAGRVWRWVPGIMLELRDYIDLEKDRLNSFVATRPAALQGQLQCQSERNGVCRSRPRRLQRRAMGLQHPLSESWRADGEVRGNSKRRAWMAPEIEPEQDPTWRKITRVEGRLLTRNVAGGDQAKWINDTHAESVGAPMHVQAADGRNLLIYADAHTEGMMTGRLVEGQSYVFIAREHSLSQNPEDALSFDLLSFDAVSR
jgi:hypothetical protein